MIRVAHQGSTLWWESLVDGPGVRLVLFLAGCKHACPGCHNAWLCNPQAGESMRESDIVSELLRSYSSGWHDGITISGGDPFYQSIELATLLQLVRKAIPSVNIWVYTGYLYEDLLPHPAFRYIDMLVDGPYIAARSDEGQTYRGSGNQRLIPLRTASSSPRVASTSLHASLSNSNIQLRMLPAHSLQPNCGR